MKTIRKNMKICIALGILCGLILLFIKLRFQLSEEETMRIYIYSSIAVLLISVRRNKANEEVNAKTDMCRRMKR